MVTGGGEGARGGDGKTLGHGGLSPYLIPFLSTPPRSADSGGPTLCTGGGGRRLRTPLPPRRPGFSLVSPRAAVVEGLAERPRRTPGGSAGLCRGQNGHYLKLCYGVAAFRPSLCLPACLPVSSGGSRTCSLAAYSSC